MLHSHFIASLLRLAVRCHATLAHDPNCVFMAGLAADQLFPITATRRSAAITTQESTQ